MGSLRNCSNCHWSQWTVEKPPCKKCQDVGAFHKWQEKKRAPAPMPIYIGHRDES